MHRVARKYLYDKNFEYLHPGSTKWADFFFGDRGWHKIFFHTNNINQDYFEPSSLIETKKSSVFVKFDKNCISFIRPDNTIDKIRFILEKWEKYLTKFRSSIKIVFIEFVN